MQSRLKLIGRLLASINTAVTHLLLKTALLLHYHCIVCLITTVIMSDCLIIIMQVVQKADSQLLALVFNFIALVN